jgi:hypothetical protein
MAKVAGGRGEVARPVVARCGRRGSEMASSSSYLGKGVEEENVTGFDSLFAASMVGGRGFHQLDVRRPRVADDMKRRHRSLQCSGRKKIGGAYVDTIYT